MATSWAQNSVYILQHGRRNFDQSKTKHLFTATEIHYSGVGGNNCETKGLNDKKRFNGLNVSLYEMSLMVTAFNACFVRWSKHK